MSKPRVDPTFGISSVDVLILAERRPACRRRESQPGSCKERENLAGDAKGKGTSGSNLKADSTDAPERGGLLRSEEHTSELQSLRHLGCRLLLENKNSKGRERRPDGGLKCDRDDTHRQRTP